MAYFGLQTESSRAVLQKERRGTLFVDNQRKLNFYLRALWARLVLHAPDLGRLRVASGPATLHRRLSDPSAGRLRRLARHLRDRDLPRRRRPLRRALVYGRSRSAPNRSVRRSGNFIGLFEDARIEALAIRDFPGLRKLWLSFLTAPLGPMDDAVDLHPMLDLMMRLARALLDPDYRRRSGADR